jgi:outer membrane protein TolC
MNRKNILFTLFLACLYQVSWANEFTLTHFLTEVEKSNLDLKVEESRNEAATARASGIRMPAPSFSLLQRRFENDNANGFEVSQTIPFPGKISSEKEYREKAALAAQSYQMGQINSILSFSRLIYIEYWLQYEVLSTLNEKRKIIVDHIKLAKSGVRSDSMLKIHLLKAESDLDLLDNQILKEKQNLVEKKLKIAELLNWPSGKLPPSPSEPSLSILPNIQVDETPQFRKLEHEVAMAQAKESENKQAWLPDFKLKLMKMNQAQMMAEFTQISVGITLPFAFPWEPMSKSNEASALRRMTEYELEKGKRKIEYTQANIVSEAEALKAQMTLIQSKLIPRAKERMKIVHNIAPRDMNSLQDHRETMEAFTDLRLQVLSLRARYEQIAAQLLQYSPTKGALYE